MSKSIELDINQLQREYFELIDTPDIPEEEVHQFLVRYPAFLPLWHPYDNVVFSKLALGNQHIVDFAFPRVDTPGITWHFIEIEKPQDSLFTKTGDPSARLSHGLRQIHDWQTWFIENRDYVIRHFPLGHLMKDQPLWQLECSLVIGRRATLSDDNRKLMQRLTPMRSSIMTFDHLGENIWRPVCKLDAPLRSARYIGKQIDVMSEMAMHISYSIKIEKDDA